ncbi:MULTISPECIES: hypothetical protein [unclassified Caballeronia]|uniref:hypothetical protein n=1 Tax=unclassified Caballeronia TaxID=2646786 RepID=UPI0028607105|nr:MULTISPECIES: hypothetical protein [unclassified Caballeronia]MDR5822763.1 hypothetical protein [Caballeronia sp. LZ043]MDR5880816.1 hypothetical protein [Caballeronia sp. LZ032]
MRAAENDKKGTAARLRSQATTSEPPDFQSVHQLNEKLILIDGSIKNPVIVSS